jgi:hypothetical protein
MTFFLRYDMGLWEKFDELGPLYIGVLVPMRRGFDELGPLIYLQVGSES